MADRFADNVQEIATCTGTAGDIMLAGAVASFATAASKHADFDVVLYAMLQGPIEEYGKGIYRNSAGPSRIVRSGAGTQVFRSTNGNAAVNWGLGNINVVCAASGYVFENLFGPNAAQGLLVQTAWPTFARRQLTSSNPTKVPVVNATGTGGNPGYDFSRLLDLHASAALADRTVGGRIVLGAAETILNGLDFGVHRFFNDDALTDQIFEVERFGIADWLMRVVIGGVAYRVLTANGSDLNDADLLGGSTLTQVRKLSFYPTNVLYRSGGLAISSQGVHTLAHGLGQMPSKVWAQLICVTGEHGYTATRRIDIGSGSANSAAPHGHIVEMDATNLYVKFASVGGGQVYETIIQAGAGSGGTTIGLTNGNWQVEFFALA